MVGYKHHLLLLLSLVLVLEMCHSWSWFSSSSETYSGTGQNQACSHGNIAEFSMEGFSNKKGMSLVENAKTKLVGSNTCWQNAYRHLLAGCSEIFAVDDKRLRFAWHLSDCFQKDSGRPDFPSCDSKSSMPKCLKNLNEDEHKVFLEFYLETNFICHQLQAQVFKHETERLVNELKRSAQVAEDKLETIEERSEYLLQNSNKISESLNSTDHRIQQLAQTSRNVQDHINVVLKHSEEVYEQSMRIAASQLELLLGQSQMKTSLEEGIGILQDSYNDLGQEMDKLRDETGEIEKEILKLGDTMFMKMKSLQSKANDIGNIAGVSLDKQQELLKGQSLALKGLESLSNFQTEALEESRITMQKLTEYGRRQQEELLHGQEQLQTVHDRLIDNSKSILEAQESFESKQASMFIALDRLFVIHNALLLESRLIKVFFIYCTIIFIIYMFTSTKQTYTVRPWLYIELCATFIIEVAILRFATTNNIETNAWIVNLVRSAFLFLAFVQLLHAVCTYRDYEVLNHQILLTLVEKVSGMQKQKELGWDSDSEVNWSSWIDTELQEEIDSCDDPDYVPLDEVGENMITPVTTIRNYNLRRRQH